ncbi:MAG: hypothetical protein JWO30_3416 [Fibrobacteres bacterium]|nr:hypothetical protein [Fibrobacterota bacterium]
MQGWIGAVLILTGIPFAQEDYSTWTHSAKIHFNTTATGANVTNLSMQNVPVLIRISSSVPGQARILTQSLASGSDLRFADADGTHLDFQIDRWDPVAGKAEIWVRVPQVDANSSADYVVAYWGKAGAGYLSDGSKVFPAGNGFAGVWHLGEGSQQTRVNSVGGGNHASPKNYDGDERSAGVIGMADSLDGQTNGDYLDLGAGFADFRAGLTYTVWVYATAAGAYERFLDIGNGPAADNILLARDGTGRNLALHIYAGSAWDLELVATDVVDSRKWVQLGVTITANSSVTGAKNTAVIYKNGVKVAEGSLSQPISNLARTKNYLGKSNWSSDPYYTGILDEPELSNTFHSADWMKLNYEIQRPDGNLITWEYEPPVKLAIKSQPDSLRVSAEGLPVFFQVDAVSDLPIAYQWYKDGAPLASAKAAVITFASVTLADAGTYRCRLTDGKDTLFSISARLSVPENYALWGHSQKIFFNTATTGAAVPGNVENFPLLIRLDASHMDFSNADASGKDLRFADADGTALPFVIERWNTTLKLAEIWVRVPKVDGNSDQDYLTMYWGKLTAKAASNGAAVFASAAGYRGVWQFDESSGDAADASGNGYMGAVGGVTGGRPGVIATGFDLAGSGHVGLAPAATGSLQAFTISMWARENMAAQKASGELEPALMGMQTGASGVGDFRVVSKDGQLNLWTRSVSGALYSTQGVDIGDDKWHFISAVCDGTNFQLYTDGVQVAALSGNILPLAGGALGIGALRKSDNTYGSGFYGSIDAVQVLALNRDAGWIKLAYETQRPDSKVLTFGTQAVTPTPAPTAAPPAGPYEGSLLVQLTCAADNTRIFYTLDGSEPDSTAGTTHAVQSSILLEKNTVIKAKAYRNGTPSATLTAAYEVRTSPGSGGDTLNPGRFTNVDPTHIISYPVQDSKVPVLVTAGLTWNPPPRGFDRFGPLFNVATTDSLAAFPGLQLTGTAMDGISLYLMDGEGRFHWMPPKDGLLWIPSAGSYFWGRDTLPPRIRFAGTEVHGADSLYAYFVMEDNVSNLQCKLHVWNGGHDSLGWWGGSSGEIMKFAFRLPGESSTPLEARFQATDAVNLSEFPRQAGRVFTLSRTLAGVSASLDLKPGLQWKLAGLPYFSHDPLSLTQLTALTGPGKLYGAVWRTSSGAKGAYELLQDRDTLPAGRGFWLASEAGAASLSFPPGRTSESDTDGLFPITLKQGWNTVTCPAFRPMAWPISPKDGDSYLRSPLKGLRGFDGTAYTRPDSLRPWEGYYVWYAGLDTMVRVGPGAARASAAATAGAKASATGGLSLVLKMGEGSPLELGAAGFAKTGLGVEDEWLPPPREKGNGGGGETWLSREGKALATDYVAWQATRAMSWTLMAQGKPQGYRMEVDAAKLPPGFQFWAVSPSRGVKYRLNTGSSVPVTGDDTLRIYAGTAEALAEVSDLTRGRVEAGGFSSSLRAVAGGLELTLMLPVSARVDVRIWSPDGKEAGGLRGLELAPGRHAWGWPALGPGREAPAQGVYLIGIDARGADWSAHRVEKFSALR